MDKEADEVFKNTVNISYSQFLILFIIHEYSVTSQKKVASFCNFTEAAVSRQVENLKKMNLLNRQENLQDRREHSLSLTQLGENHLQMANQEVEKMVGKMFSELSGTESNQFEKVLDFFIDKLNK